MFTEAVETGRTALPPADVVLTPRLRLAPIGPADVEDLIVLYRDPLVAFWTGPWNPASVQAWAADMATRWSVEGVGKWLARLPETAAIMLSRGVAAYLTANSCSGIALDLRDTMLSVEELDATLVLRAGGWDPRYAVTLAVASHDGVGAALIDTNGDEADIDLDIYERDANGVWREGGSSGVGDVGASLSGKTAVTWGRAAPGLTVDIEYVGQRYSVVTAKTGWWLFVALAVSGSDDLPSYIGTSD